MAYLARYTHRVAITNSRLLELDETHVRFRWKKVRQGGGYKRKVMRVQTAEFVRRFLLHVLPNGFHRIRHYGFLANGHRANKLALCRSLLAVATVPAARRNDHGDDLRNPKHKPPPCQCCGGRVRIIQTLEGLLCRPYAVRKLDGL